MRANGPVGPRSSAYCHYCELLTIRCVFLIAKTLETKRRIFRFHVFFGCNNTAAFFTFAVFIAYLIRTLFIMPETAYMPALPAFIYRIAAYNPIRHFCFANRHCRTSRSNLVYNYHSLLPTREAESRSGWVTEFSTKHVRKFLFRVLSVLRAPPLAE
jgi:hypothetical protein